MKPTNFTVKLDNGEQQIIAADLMYVDSTGNIIFTVTHSMSLGSDPMQELIKVIASGYWVEVTRSQSDVN